MLFCQWRCLCRPCRQWLQGCLLGLSEDGLFSAKVAIIYHLSTDKGRNFIKICIYLLAWNKKREFVPIELTFLLNLLMLCFFIAYPLSGLQCGHVIAPTCLIWVLFGHWWMFVGCRFVVRTPLFCFLLFSRGSLEGRVFVVVRVSNSVQGWSH